MILLEVRVFPVWISRCHYSQVALQPHNYIIQTTLAEKALKCGSSIPIQPDHRLTIAPLGPHRLM